jgi:Fe-S oxidoreductase
MTPLLGEYIGHSTRKTREILKRAMGGIVFIDEAYLCPGGKGFWHKEAISTVISTRLWRQANYASHLEPYWRWALCQ